jgi:branched-chain amino acid transport system substrate-binding protein
MKGFRAQRRWRSLIVGSLTVALVAAGCSSSKKATSSATTASTAASGGSTATTKAGAASGGDIVVGGVVQASQFPDTAIGFQARITRANSEGGIGGHQIKFVGAQDDGGTAATDQQIIQSLILNDHVVAIAPVTTVGLSAASTDFAAQNHTPMLGWSFLPNMCATTWVYGFNGCLVNPKILNSSLMDPIIGVLGGASKVRLAVQANNNAVGASASSLYPQILEKRGGTTVYKEQNIPDNGSIDYTPYVQAILKTKPNLIILGVIFSQAIAMAGALKAAGYTGAIQDFQTYFPGLLSQANVAAALEGEYINAQIPPQEAQTPAIKQLEKDLVAIGKTTTISLGEQVGYWTGDLFVQILQATSKAGNPLTGDGIQKTVNAGFQYTPTLDGGVGPQKFPDAENVPTPCASLVQVKDKKYAVAVPFKCYENLPNS